MELPIYKVIFDEENINVFGMSLVDEPANQTEWITMSKDQPIIMSLNEDKRLVSGVVLRPGQLIYRNPTASIKTPFYMVFEKEDIEKFAYDFILNNNQNNLTLNHEEDFSGAKLVESYILRNENKELKAEEGSWILTYKIFDTKLWEEIKDNKFTGFSLEGYMTLIQAKSEEKEKEKEEDPKDTVLTDKDLEEIFDEIKKHIKK